MGQFAGPAVSSIGLSGYVLKTFQVTEWHSRELFSNTPDRCCINNSESKTPPGGTVSFRPTSTGRRIFGVLS
jgi:hypothetical protein